MQAVLTYPPQSELLKKKLKDMMRDGGLRPPYKNIKTSEDVESWLHRRMISYRVSRPKTTDLFR